MNKYILILFTFLFNYSYAQQGWNTDPQFPQDQIKEAWDDGRDISSLSYGNGVWTLVTTKIPGNYLQSWFTRTYFPKDKIEENWDG